jgi:hypothetical protein
LDDRQHFNFHTIEDAKLDGIVTVGGRSFTRAAANQTTRIARYYASVIYNSCASEQPVVPFGENFMPQVSQPAIAQKNYGRQIPEIQPKEILPETGQDQQRESEKERRGRRPVRRRQKKVNGPGGCLSRCKNQERQIPCALRFAGGKPRPPGRFKPVPARFAENRICDRLPAIDTNITVVILSAV